MYSVSVKRGDSSGGLYMSQNKEEESSYKHLFYTLSAILFCIKYFTSVERLDGLS